MSRPKTGRETKKKITLCVTDEVREMLNNMSQYYQKSISEMIEDFAKKEQKKIIRKTKSTTES